MTRKDRARLRALNIESIRLTANIERERSIANTADRFGLETGPLHRASANCYLRRLRRIRRQVSSLLGESEVVK